MYSLVINGSKATFYLMWILALPLFLEMEAILTLWLKEPPGYATSFTRLVLVESLILSISLPVLTAARAPGKMAVYESTLGALQFSILLISWLLLKADFGPKSVFYVAIVVNVIMFIVRLGLVNRLTGLPVIRYLEQTLIPVFGVAALSCALSGLVAIWRPDGPLYLVTSVVTTLLITSLAIYWLGLPKEMRARLKAFMHGKLRIMKRLSWQF